jgi:hypothetical protein
MNMMIGIHIIKNKACVNQNYFVSLYYNKNTVL